MIPAGTDDETRAIAALAEKRIEELGTRRFGAEWGIRSSAWWTVHLLAADGYARDQIITVIEERVAAIRDRMEEEEATDNARFHLEVWAEIKAAIATTK